MPDPASANDAYREWSRTSEELLVFARPQWLDLVAPDAWCSELIYGPRGRCVGAWPYVPTSRMGLRWASLPRATPYLGPVLTDPPTVASGKPPGALGYIAFTVRDPSAAWRYGRACRAMATQVIDLNERPRYSSSIGRLIRRGRGELSVRQAVSREDFGKLRLLLREQPASGDYRSVAAYTAACERGLASTWLAEDGEGRTQGMVVVPEDRRCAYLAVQVRASEAHAATMAVLVDEVLSDLERRGIPRLDFESGFLPGVREFHRRLGARPCWYGLVRLSRGPAYSMLERIRAATNRRRI